MNDETAELEALIAGSRSLDGQGGSDEEIATWLKARAADFGKSGKVLAHARGISRGDAFDTLRATATWQRVETRFQSAEFDGQYRGEYLSVNGRTFSVGDVLKLPGGPRRVLAVDPSDDPSITARLITERAERDVI